MLHKVLPCTFPHSAETIRKKATASEEFDDFFQKNEFVSQRSDTIVQDPAANIKSVFRLVEVYGNRFVNVVFDTMSMFSEAFS